MTCREESGQVWKHDYNEENRISVVYKMDGADCTTQGSPTHTWTYMYDGNGVRVKEVYDVGGTDQYTKYFFAGGGYEVEVNHVPNPDTTTTKKYYSFAGMMVAMDDGTDLVYFANDHLTSASLVMDDSGTLLSENRYMPFGEVRTISGMTNISETDFGYTGQRNIADIGLMDYNARFYSPTLGRFLQPDTIIPSMGNPQSLNRFSYVNNSPILFIDPSGHRYCTWDGDGCDQEEYDSWDPGNNNGGGGENILSPKEKIIKQINSYGWNVNEEWTYADLVIVLAGIKANAEALAQAYTSTVLCRKFGDCGPQMSPKRLSSEIFGGQTFTFDPNNVGWSDETNQPFYCERVGGSSPGVTCYSNASGANDFTVQTIAHEIGHVFNAIIVNNMKAAGITGYTATQSPYSTVGALDIDFNDGLTFREHNSDTNWENYADTHANWVLGKIITEREVGIILQNAMDSHMPRFINYALGNFP